MGADFKKIALFYGWMKRRGWARALRCPKKIGLVVKTFLFWTYEGIGLKQLLFEFRPRVYEDYTILLYSINIKNMNILLNKRQFILSSSNLHDHWDNLLFQCSDMKCYFIKSIWNMEIEFCDFIDLDKKI